MTQAMQNIDIPHNLEERVLVLIFWSNKYEHYIGMTRNKNNASKTFFTLEGFHLGIDTNINRLFVPTRTINLSNSFPYRHMLFSERHALWLDKGDIAVQKKDQDEFVAEAFRANTLQVDILRKMYIVYGYFAPGSDTMESYMMRVVENAS